MSAFFVGQRVRIVRTRNHPEMIGTQAVIVSGPVTIQGVVGWELNVHVPGNPFVRYAEPHQLEPILPEGMQPARWEDCLWQPEGVFA